MLLHALLSFILSFNDDSYNFNYTQIFDHGKITGPNIVCDGDALTYFRLSSDLTKNHKLILDEECEQFKNSSVTTPPDPDTTNYLLFTLQISRQKIAPGQMPTVEAASLNLTRKKNPFSRRNNPTSAVNSHWPFKLQSWRQHSMFAWPLPNLGVRLPSSQHL